MFTIKIKRSPGIDETFGFPDPMLTYEAIYTTANVYN